MDFINLKSLNLTGEESEDLIKLLAQKRITTKELLSIIKICLILMLIKKLIILIMMNL